jgi:hypothetical protein
MLVYLAIEFALLISNEQNQRFYAQISNAKSKSKSRATATEGWVGSAPPSPCGMQPTSNQVAFL